MKYVNAHTILPKDLVEELQKYIQAGYIYIPAAGKKKRWGEHSGYRTELQLRNEGIRQRYVSGCTIEELSTQYALSAHAIKKIRCTMTMHRIPVILKSITFYTSTLPIAIS